MKKFSLALLILILAVLLFLIFKDRLYILPRPITENQEVVFPGNFEIHQKNLLKYLKLREDSLAAMETEKILSAHPGDICALWAKAELLRRAYKFKDSERILNQVLSRYNNCAPALISLSYIRYHDNKFKEATQILSGVLKKPQLQREDRALACMLMGCINAKKAARGGFMSKIIYGLRIKGFFERAKSIAPDVPEVRLGLGSFYLLAPDIAGGNIDKAIEELECAVQLAPNFATANARLAQAYKKIGDTKNYSLYLNRAKESDPGNEVLQEMDIK